MDRHYEVEHGSKRKAWRGHLHESRCCVSYTTIQGTDTHLIIYSAGVTSIVRCINIRLLYEEDFTFEAGILAMWTAAEMSVTIIAASIPVLRILVRNIVTHRSYSNSGGNGNFLGGTHTSVVAHPRRGLKSGSSGDADSTTSLGLPRQSSGHIVKFETVTVDYERRSMSQSENINNSYSFEMAHVAPKRQNSARRF